ncbi:MAG: DEAD/DEAH box helicase family protein, partial [Propionibacterium sp.]|nr:DEAD/DEAH box helicase family protein [Propionibacterium sp.]
MSEPLAEGLYDALITARLDEDLRRSPLRAGRKPIEPDERPDAFAHHVAEVLRRVLPGLKPELQLRVVNELLSELNDDATQVVAAERLISLTHEPEPGRIPAYTTHPSTRLGQAALLTNAKGDLALGNELRAELDSADSVDLLCAFIKWRGLNTMTDELNRIRDRGVPFRVITTTYMGATERRALDRLVTDFGARVKISYELERTRLHAKAWQFRRNTGFHTAYVGSSNLSYPALLEGVEWNVRLSSAATPHLLRKFAATFDTYWADPAYETYDPERDAERLDVALGEAGGQRSRDRVTLTTSGLDVRPYPHQREALESLDAERDKGHHRNLIIAATGTGKTVIAALDYRNLCELWQRRPSLLFVAHRREILEQALRTYREVLNDANFGELYVAGRQPSNWQHLFASVQTLNARDITSMAPDALEVVVIDEFHHAAAASYQALLNHLQPRELLGLTATPERTDGFDVRHYFDQRTAVEMRLWDALEADLLSPFHYFGIGDGTDLTRLTWARGSYDTTQLSN